MSKEASATKKKRVRKPKNFLLVQVDHTEPDEDGNAQEVYVPMPFPPGLDEAQLRNRDAIKRACRKAVYELGMKEYGNVEMAIMTYDEYFRIEFSEQTITRLVPPSDG